MARYHVNPETGNPNKCSAKVRCPYGGDADHIETNDINVAREFAEKKNAEAAGQTVSATQSDLSRALQNYGLSAGDIEDIDKAWKQKFGELEKPKPESVDIATLSVLGIETVGRSRGGFELDGVSADGTVEISVYTRNGGGNRECYCEWEAGDLDRHLPDDEHFDDCTAAANEAMQASKYYADDEDDEYDYTYATFYFEIPDGKDADRVKEAFANSGERFRLDRLETEKKQYIKGEKPLWHLNATDAEQQRIQELTSDIQKNKNMLRGYRAEKAEQTMKVFSEPLTKYIDGDIESLPESFEKSGLNTPIRRKDRDYRFNYHVREIKETVNTYRSSKEKLKTYDDAIAQVEQLEDGSPLKELLTKNRGEGSYKTTEGRGRGKRTVTRTYDRGAEYDIYKDRDRTKDVYDRAEKSFKSLKESAQEYHNEQEALVDDYNQKKREVEQAEKEFYRIGWKKDTEPPKPKSTGKSSPWE